MPPEFPPFPPPLTDDDPPDPPFAFPPEAPFPPLAPTFIVNVLPPSGIENLPILPWPPLPPEDPLSLPPLPPAPPTTRMDTSTASSGMINVWFPTPKFFVIVVAAVTF